MKVKFVPQNIEIEIEPNETLLQAANRNGIFIKSICKGVPQCAECRVKIAEGEYNVLPPSAKELDLIGTAQFVDNSRLACQLRCFGDITVDLTEQVEKAERDKTRKAKIPDWYKKKTDGEAEEKEVVPEVVVDDDPRSKREIDLQTAEQILYEEEKKRELDRIRRQITDKMRK